MDIPKSINLSTNISGLKLKNPVITASGTFGYAREFQDLVDLTQIGAIVSKSITLEPWPGNPPPRICETTAGMLNAIGLQNEGVQDFLKNKLPFLKSIGSPVIVSIAGKTKEEYKKLAEIFNETEIDALEINISCPNISKIKGKSKQPSRLFSQSAEDTAEVIRLVKKNTDKIIIAKLSPNVTNISEIAKSAEKSGAHAICLINTLLGMAVDINNKRPKLANITGGLSGPAIKPIALRMVWEVYNNVSIPIIGTGGIMNGYDAIEFFLCGASAVQIGTANFINPKTVLTVLEDIMIYFKNNNLRSIDDIIGALNEEGYNT